MLGGRSSVVTRGSRSRGGVWMFEDRRGGIASGARCCWSKGLSCRCSRSELARTVCWELAGIKKVSSATLALLLRGNMVSGLVLRI